MLLAQPQGGEGRIQCPVLSQDLFPALSLGDCSMKGLFTERWQARESLRVLGNNSRLASC